MSTAKNSGFRHTSKEKRTKIEKRALTPEEVADAYSIATGTLANMRSKKVGIKFYRCGRKILYRREDVENFVFSNPVMTSDAHHTGEQE